MRAEITQDIRSILNAPDLEEAEHLLAETVKKYDSRACRPAQWVQKISMPKKTVTTDEYAGAIGQGDQEKNKGCHALSE